MKKILFVLLALLIIFSSCVIDPDPGNKDGDKNGDNGVTLDKSALNAEIAKAEAAKEGVVTAVNASEVVKGKKWVTAAVIENFTGAIEEAKKALNATTQAAVDAARIALSAAIDAFNEAKNDGNKTSGFTQAELTDLINDATAAKAGVGTSADGTDIGMNKSWVTQAVMAALDNAIAAAQSASGNLDPAYLALEQAIEDFSLTRQLGAKLIERTVTITGLNVPDGTVIRIVLSPTNQYGLFVTLSEGYIQNTMVTITLTLDDQTNIPWYDDGSYYVQFAIMTDTNHIYISKSTVTFSDSSPAKTMTINDFDYTSFNPDPNPGTDPGPGPEPALERTVTITGLNVPDGTEIQIQLAPTKSLGSPQAFSKGFIQDNMVTVTVFWNINDEPYIPWDGSGSYYVIFGMITVPQTPPDNLYISKSLVTFNDSSPGHTMTFNDFDEFDDTPYEHGTDD